MVTHRHQNDQIVGVKIRMQRVGCFWKAAPDFLSQAPKPWAPQAEYINLCNLPYRFPILRKLKKFQKFNLQIRQKSFYARKGRKGNKNRQGFALGSTSGIY
jgi:hypothetical protein